MSDAIGRCKYCRAKRKFYQQTEYWGDFVWSFYVCLKCGWQTEAVKVNARKLPQGLEKAD